MPLRVSWQDSRAVSSGSRPDHAFATKMFKSRRSISTSTENENMSCIHRCSDTEMKRFFFFRLHQKEICILRPYPVQKHTEIHSDTCSTYMPDRM